MADKTFVEAFNENMEAMGLPVPSTAFEKIGTALGMIGAMAASITQVGATATVSELLLTIPVAAGKGALATAVVELTAVAGGLAASFYVGACVGSVLVAAYETLNPVELTAVADWFVDVQRKLGPRFLTAAFARHPQLSPVRMSQVLAGISANPSGPSVKKGWRKGAHA